MSWKSEIELPSSIQVSSSQVRSHVVASDNERKVFVAGGHDNEKNALRNDVCDTTQSATAQAQAQPQIEGRPKRIKQKPSRMRIPSDLDSVQPCIIRWDGRLLAVGCVGSGERCV
nr:hypothetical protein [Tanacetum cinerariifolium]